uniref:Aminotran_5 domain-containing protein n=1 Tax=Schistocephalus solidus TaxID=70667 RepID=A0A183SH95_SCHSO
LLIYLQGLPIFKMNARPTSSSGSKGISSYRGRKLLNFIHANLLNADSVIYGPFGDRKVIYCDFTASGLSLKCFEEFILNEVLTDYANVHSVLSGTASQTTDLRNDAKVIIKNAVNAQSSDAIIFVGSGTTYAIHKLIHNLNLTEPPIVLNGPFEHHSNSLPWTHLAHKVIRLKTTIDGDVSIPYLEEMLRVIIFSIIFIILVLVCLSAASNVTGILVDTVKISSLVHRYGGIIFWDYATAAPYDAYKDAVFFSVHKFVGGPQTPGILVAKKSLFEAGQLFPHTSGGGTVEFVRRQKTTYLKDVEGREEGGTPAIVESIRAGMVIQLQQAIGMDIIAQREEQLVINCPNLIVLGGSKVKRLAIFSFLVRHTQSCLFIHHDFVCALLNDLFGIQSRSGCACAGPYALDLLGINENLATSYEEALITQPGFTRINLPFFYPDEEVEFILDAIVFIATYGWYFLPFYEYNPLTGFWHYASDHRTVTAKHLHNISYERGVMRYKKAAIESNGEAPKSLKVGHYFSLMSP